MNNCVICNRDAKYKCPTCLIYYCSVSCCRQHRAQNCELALKPPAPETSEDKKPIAIKFPTEDTVPLEKLEQLKDNEELKKILANPHLRNLLEKVDKSENPDAAMQMAMVEPLFVEFADECLKVIQPRESDDET